MRLFRERSPIFCICARYARVPPAQPRSMMMRTSDALMRPTDAWRQQRQRTSKSRVLKTTRRNPAASQRLHSKRLAAATKCAGKSTARAFSRLVGRQETRSLWSAASSPGAPGRPRRFCLPPPCIFVGSERRRNPSVPDTFGGVCKVSSAAEQKRRGRPASPRLRRACRRTPYSRR